MFSNYMNLQNMFTQLNISFNLSATLDMEKDGGLKFLHQVYGDYTERSIFAKFNSLPGVNQTNQNFQRERRKLGHLWDIHWMRLAIKRINSENIEMCCIEMCEAYI